ncbi:hypothetical protein CM19_04285 [Candidatus Acidianus copahuensis]|uniref:HTH bat-type domain-containing protein n=1 Tax=Candidatus Acidianus copahuensis TaxID=1160895 RepID=A0A031LRZ3_9CREN|nr:helix-turn-helix domain-containing protein [Candidatus Acidianus copahuensis]EZQ10269.1 hypothetical protein CM19_04285 [Candidatus Acidianus copahuensis]
MKDEIKILRIEVLHESCWTEKTDNFDVKVQTIYEDFPNMEVYNSQLLVWGKDSKKFIKMIKSNVYIVNTFGEEVKLINCICRRDNTISDIVKKYQGTILSQYNFEGTEYWKILIKNNVIDKFRERLEEISHIKGFQVTDLTSFSPFPELTNIQKKIIIKAFSKGYYSFPKNANAREISKELGISPVTFIYHLRKAERNIIKHYLNNA